MESEWQGELDKDQSFVGKINEEDFESSDLEPELILELTKLADKYVDKFKIAEKRSAETD